ncbi:MAG: hypothetical protein AAFX95_19285 [Cyanobacteria bacterium J06639_16]
MMIRKSQAIAQLLKSRVYLLRILKGFNSICDRALYFYQCDRPNF